MTLRFHEIAEANHRILNPFTEEKLILLGEICQLKAGMRQLDLCCGKAEMLSQWARRYEIEGVGVDISKVFLDAARQRAQELGVADKVTFVEGDAAKYKAQPQHYDVVSCIGATWIGNGLVGTLALMKPVLREGGLLLVGEPYWIDPPPAEAYGALEVGEHDFVSLDGMLDRFEQAGVELVEMVLANHDSWDRYAASQWMTLSSWLRENPNDLDAPAIREWYRRTQRAYLQYERRYFGWGVFVLRTIHP